MICRRASGRGLRAFPVCGGCTLRCPRTVVAVGARPPKTSLHARAHPGGHSRPTTSSSADPSTRPPRPRKSICYRDTQYRSPMMNGWEATSCAGSDDRRRVKVRELHDCSLYVGCETRGKSVTGTSRGIVEIVHKSISHSGRCIQ